MGKQHPIRRVTKPPPTRRESLAFQAVDPFTGKKRPVQLAYEKLMALPRQGKGKVLEAAYTVKHVLETPSSVFRGLTEETDEPSKRGTGWLCYVGRAKSCYEDDGRPISVPADRVFLVFVNDEWVAYTWYWCKADAMHPELPENHASRFKEKLL